ncbi:hypothetical protein [Pedobacter ureilyticus]|uniref:Uncharacterized protein n=1 Tax=Pedobacter ureilyticus TaxID=1393051 RepID=A0ABW9J776_9SPHI|nr:hypothetical protein [Pedobacter helvus]
MKETILAFLDSIGIKYAFSAMEKEGFLPGLELREGVLIIDPEKLKYVGDILHEAGHLACMPLAVRAGMTGVLPNNDMMQGGEMMAMAWSFAACKHLQLEATVVFHKDGYKGEAATLIAAYEAGNGPGIPLLQWLGMCYDQHTAAQNGTQPFPHMKQWLCTTNKYTA